MDGDRIGRITDELMVVLGTGGIGRAVSRSRDGRRLCGGGAGVRTAAGSAGSGWSGARSASPTRTIWPTYGVSGADVELRLRQHASAISPRSPAGSTSPGCRSRGSSRRSCSGWRRRPAAGMSDDELLGCVGWVAHGFEIVQSVYPGWKLTGPESAAAFGLHGALMDRRAAPGRRRPGGMGRACSELHADAAQRRRGGGRGRGRERPRRADPGAALPGRGGGALPGQRADRPPARSSPPAR